MGVRLSRKMQDFAAEVYPAVLGTTRKDGSVQVNPVWFEYRDGLFWVNGASTRGWFKHLQRDPRVTLLLLDPKDMFRWAQVEGRMLQSAEDPGGDHINHLSHRYTGGDYQNSRDGRITVQIEPTRITGSIDGWG